MAADLEHCRKRLAAPERRAPSHARRAAGVPHRIDAFDAALAHICRHEGVWKATGAEIARQYAAAQAKQ